MPSCECIYIHFQSICVFFHFLAFWFSSFTVSPPGNISGFSASVARTFFFSLNLPEWDTLTWRPLLAVVLSTILSSRASSWESCTETSAWAPAPVAAPNPCWPAVALETSSLGISYRTLGWDFCLLKNVSFHQPEDGSVMMEEWWDRGLKRRKKDKKRVRIKKEVNKREIECLNEFLCFSPSLSLFVCVCALSSHDTVNMSV